MMDQSTTNHPQTLPPPMTNYIPPSVPPIFAPNHHQQQQQQQQPSLVQYPPTAAATSSSDAEVSTANFNAQQQQQQQMAAMMQMQQQWASGGYAAPFMMPYPPGMMMMQPQAGTDRPASRQSSRPPSRQSVTAPVSSSRSMVNGQTGNQTQASSAQGMLPTAGYPGYVPPGMYNPWFDPYWQSMYAGGGYQHPYSFGYNDEMMKYWKQMSQAEDDRYSHHSQSKQSQHSSSMQTWGSIDSLNDPYYQNHNQLVNGYYPSKQQTIPNQPKRPTKPNPDSTTLLTTAPIPNQQITSVESKTKTIHKPDDEEEKEESDDDDDDDSSEEEESSDGSSDRFSIKSDLAQVNEESSKARRTPLLYIRPHLRAKFVFDQLIQILPQSPSDTNQPATVEIVSANSLHSVAPFLVEERQLMSDFIGPLTASTAKSNVIRYCERQSQLANKSNHIIDRDALSILWQYMALLVKTNGVIDVRVDIPKLLWSSSNTPLIEESSSNSNSTSTTLENSLREFLALGEIDTSIKFACENQLYTHALIISYLTDKQLFEKTMHNIIANLDNGDVLKTFYELGAGSTPSVVSNVTKAHYGDWKRHLAVILANRTDVNAQFVDLCVKTMGDTLVTSGRIYAGHFCYLIANIPFGSYRNNADKLAVIGSIHAGQSNLSFATIQNLQLTEVYEYAVRKCLTTFIPLKIYYTSKLVLHGLRREALAYCEEIGQTLIRQGNTSYIQLLDLQLFILIAEKSRAFSRNFQLDPASYKEPTWLIELRRIIQNLIDKTFLNKTVHDELLDSSLQKPNLPTHTDKQTLNINRPAEPKVTNVPSLTISNGYDPTEPISYPNTLTVDTNVHYPTPVQSNYYQPPSQQYYPNDPQQTEINTYAQPWSQQPTIPTQSDLLNQPNNSFYQPPVDQSQYIQPGFTSTPNSYPAQQQWHPPGQVEQRERLPSNENQSSTFTEEPPPQQPQQHTNGQVKKQHAIFDDSDDVFPNKSQKPTDTQTSATPAAAAGPKSGLVGSLFNRLGWKRPTQAHLPDDKNKTLKFDQQTGRWIDTAKSADEQASTQLKPPPMMPSNNTSSSFENNPQQQQPSSTFNPSMPPGSSQPRTLSFAAGSTTTGNSAVVPPTTAAAWPPQSNTNIAPTTTQPPQQQQQQPQQQQQQQKAPVPLSAAQQRLQAIRQQQQQQATMQQAQAPPATSSNQYSLKNRQNQSRYVDVLASAKGGVAPTPNVSLNDLIPTPSATVPTYGSSNQINNYFVPGSVQSTTGSHEQSSS